MKNVIISHMFILNLNSVRFRSEVEPLSAVAPIRHTLVYCVSSIIAWKLISDIYFTAIANQNILKLLRYIYMKNIN
jgi:hypothetical protein